MRHTDRQRQACCSFTEVHLQHQHQHQQCHCSLFCACYGLHKPETDRKSVSLSCWNISYHVMSRHVMSGAGQRFEPRTVGSSLLTLVLCMGSAVSVYLRASVRRRLVSPGRFQCVSSCSCAGLLSLWSCWWTPADAQCWSISIHRLRCCCCCCCASFWIVPVEPQETVMLIKFSRNNNNSSSNTQKLQSAPDEKKMLLFRGQRKAPADGQIQASGRLHWRCRAPSCR